MAGILYYSTYIPRNRLRREAVGTPTALGVTASVKGTRSVAGYDEDTTSMGVEAARLLPQRVLAERIGQVLFGAGRPAYLEKTNATLIHRVLGFAPDTAAIDMVGSVRSASAALTQGLKAAGRTLSVLSDVRTSLPGGADERDGGDAAATFLLTGDDEPVAALLLAHAVISEEFLDRWRVPDQAAARRWEERFGQDLYLDLGRRALAKALADAGLALGDVDHLVVASSNTRALRLFGKVSGVSKDVTTDDLVEQIGNTGAAHAALGLGAVLDAAEPDKVIAVVTLADGAEVLIFRTTAELVARRAAISVAAQLAAPAQDVSYTDFLRWRGMLIGEEPRRAAPIDAPAPSLHRVERWRLGLEGTECTACATRSFPPQRVCRGCGVLDQMIAVSAVEDVGSVVTAVIDRLAWSPGPPLVFATVNLERGGRVQMELTEVNGQEIAPGAQVEPTFRRRFTATNGVHNYFWKMRPVAAGRV